MGATDRPREELARIVASYGREVVSDPRRTEGLLRDTCGSCEREVFILASVQKKHIPDELLALAPSVPGSSSSGGSPGGSSGSSGSPRSMPSGPSSPGPSPSRS